MADPRRQTAFALAATALGLLLGLAVAEGVARQLDLPRIQTIGLGGTARLVDGVPVWRDPEGSPARENADCAGPRVLLLGSSILYGSGLEPDASLGPALEARLPGLCVENLAQPAFTFDNQRAVADERLARAPTPEVVVWEVWQNSVNRIDVIGDAAYNFGELEVDAGGVPSVLGFGPGANRALFAASALVRQLSVRLAPTSRTGALAPRWEAFADGPLRGALDRVREAGATPVLVLMPPLDRPFAESAAQPFVGYVFVEELAAREGVAVVDAAGRLAGASHEALRADPCCHYNPDGIQALADVLAPEITAARR